MDFLIQHILRTSAERLPEKEALIHRSQRLSYSEVARQVAGLARGLRRAGLQRGDRIGIYLDPSVPQLLSIFAISEAVASLCPTRATLTPPNRGDRYGEFDPSPLPANFVLARTEPR